jgi:hypothetical protein
MLFEMHESPHGCESLQCMQHASPFGAVVLVTASDQRYGMNIARISVRIPEPPCFCSPSS